jgi:hypothetical protein
VKLRLWLLVIVACLGAFASSAASCDNEVDLGFSPDAAAGDAGAGPG